MTSSNFLCSSDSSSGLGLVLLCFICWKISIAGRFAIFACICALISILTSLSFKHFADSSLMICSLLDLYNL
ncbi:hypothetical protein [Rickettsia conorii]|uniref:hypothetical protein n=1 Tax=Rickettsia conorii TaxID=781 RepID=UPI003AF1A35E